MKLRRCIPFYVIRHFLVLVSILTALITASVFYRFKGSPPPKVLYGAVSYTDKFNLTIPRDLRSTIEPWNVETEEYNRVLRKNGKTKRLLGEFHTHTNYSDGRLTPMQVVDWALAYGFNLLFVTDHNTVEGGLAAQAYTQENDLDSRIKVIPGVEYTCCRIHMNLLGINETIRPSESWPTDEELKKVIRRTHDLGGMVVVNHLPWSCSTEYGRHVSRLQGHPTRLELLAWGADAFESVAEGNIDLATVRFSEAYNLPYITATDLHDPEVAPNAWTILDLPLPDDYPLQEISTREIIDFLTDTTTSFRKNVNFYYDAIGPIKQRVYPPTNPAYHWYAAFVDVFDFTVFWSESKGLYSFVPSDSHPFCHAYTFSFHWRTAVAFIFNALLAFLLFESIVYFVQRLR